MRCSPQVTYTGFKRWTSQVKVIWSVHINYMLRTLVGTYCNTDGSGGLHQCPLVIIVITLSLRGEGSWLLSTSVLKRWWCGWIGYVCIACCLSPHWVSDVGRPHRDFNWGTGGEIWNRQNYDVSMCNLMLTEYRIDGKRRQEGSIEGHHVRWN